HGKKDIGSHWIFKSKFRADGSVERKNDRLVIQGNRQRKGVDYEETFAPVANMATLRSLLVVVAMNGWEKCQMDVSNVFLHGDLLEEMYMIMPPGYVGKGKCVQNVTNSTSLVCKLKKLLYGLKQGPRQWFFKLSSALLSFDDLLITSSDPSQIQQLKDQLSSTFHMKDLNMVYKMLNLINSQKDHNLKLQADMGSPFADPKTYRKLIVVQCQEGLLLDIASYWVVSLLKDIGLTDLGPADLHCDNQVALHIAANLMFHARTKHIKVDCHFVRDQIKADLVKPSYVNTKLQLADVFTKVISVDQHKLLLDKLGVSQSLHSQFEGEYRRKTDKRDQGIT
ncbi:cysteine-rich receptor-like protein kinase 8, partial [Tanacetum coccineum]